MAAGPVTAQTASAFDALLVAWEEWDLHPGDRSKVIARQEAVTAFSVALGLDQGHVYRQCSAGRRAGLSYSDVLEAIQAGKVLT